MLRFRAVTPSHTQSFLRAGFCLGRTLCRPSLLAAMAFSAAISLGLALHSTTAEAREPWLISNAPSSAGQDAFVFSSSSAGILFPKVNDAVSPSRNHYYLSRGPGTPVVQIHAPSDGAFNLGSAVATPDGQNIIYLGDFSSRGTMRLYKRQLSAVEHEDFSWPSLANLSTQVRSFEVSPDSSSVVFTAEDRVGTATATSGLSLYSRRLDGVGGTQVLVSNTSPSIKISAFRVTPNSARVVFTGNMGNGFGQPTGGLYSRAIDGTDTPVRLAAGATDFNLTPDSSRVIFTLNGALFSVPTAGGAVVALSNAAAGFTVDSFIVSPDGARVAYRLAGFEAGVFKQHLWSVRTADGGGAVVLTPPSVAGVGGHLASLVGFAQGSAQVILVHNKKVAGVYQITSSASAGGVAPVDLTSSAGPSVGFPTLSADASWAVFHNGPDLVSVPTNGGAARTLSGPTVSGASIFYFVLSPDSANVAFVANRDNIVLPTTGGIQRELYTVPITGGTPTRASGVIATGALGVNADFFGGARSTTLAYYIGSAAIAFVAEKQTGVGGYQVYGTAADGFGKLLDIDGDGKVLATTDLLLILRYHLGLRNAALTTGTKGAPGATRTTDAALTNQLTYLFTGDGGRILNADGNTSITYHDLALIVRYLLGFRGAPLLDGALGTNAILNTPISVEYFVRRLLESPGL